MKVTRKSNFRIEVTPKGLNNFGFVSVSDKFFGETEDQIAKDYLERCEHMADQIRRHVDYVRGAEVVFDSKEECSHCGSEWDAATDDTDPEWPKGTPFCCDRAIQEFQESQKQTA